MPKSEKKVTPEVTSKVKKTRTRRPVVVMLAARLQSSGGIYSLETPWGNQVFNSVEDAVAATASEPEYCRANDVRTITVSPRIVPKAYQPRTPKMVFDTPELSFTPFTDMSSDPSPEGPDNAPN